MFEYCVDVLVECVFGYVDGYYECVELCEWIVCGMVVGYVWCVYDCVL